MFLFSNTLDLLVVQTQLDFFVFAVSYVKWSSKAVKQPLWTIYLN